MNDKLCIDPEHNYTHTITKVSDNIGTASNVHSVIKCACMILTAKCHEPQTSKHKINTTQQKNNRNRSLSIQIHHLLAHQGGNCIIYV